ncbi:MAG: histidine triad nucleotide-binding protein [Myxococcota bacterium]
MSQSCLFCRIVDGKIPAETCYNGEHVLAFADIKPVAPVHVLVIPKQHIASLSQLQPQHSEVSAQLMLGIQKVVQSHNLDGSGYRVVMNTGSQAGQEVLHLHAHVLGGRCFTWPPG